MNKTSKQRVASSGQKFIDEVELRVVIRYVGRTKALSGRKVRDLVEDILATRMPKPLMRGNDGKIQNVEAAVRVEVCHVMRYQAPKEL